MDKLLVREDIAKLLSKNQIGVELGVAEGGFSESLLKNTDDSFHLFSIDMWAGDRGHDVNQYNRCIKRLMPFKSRSSIIRSTFKNSLDIFPNDYFDFIYVDGYAHTGEENGQTFYDWWDKLKSGGVLAGDDYDRQVWNKVYTCVNSFCSKKNVSLNVIDNKPEHRKHMGTTWADKSPTWYIYKP